MCFTVIYPSLCSLYTVTHFQLYTIILSIGANYGISLTTYDWYDTVEFFIKTSWMGIIQDSRHRVFLSTHLPETVSQSLTHP